MPWGTKNMPPKKNLSRGSLSNWCDVDADADISKTICRPPPYGGVDIRMDSAYVLNTNIHYTNVMHIGVVVACDITQTEAFLLLIKLKGVLQLPGLPLDHVGRGHVKTRQSPPFY